MPKVGEGFRPAAEALLGDSVEDKVGEGEAGECAAILEVTQDLARAGEALPLIEPTPTELQGVPSLEERELLRDLVGLDVVERRTAGAAESPVADVEPAQAGGGLPAGNADRRVGVADAGPVRGDRLELHAREPEEQLVDGARAQDTGPVEGQAQEGRVVRGDQVALQRRSLRLGLVPLVRDAREHAIVAGEACVELEVSLVRPLLVRRGCDEVVPVAGPVGKRVERLAREDRPCDRAEAADGNDIARERLPGERIEDGHVDAREVTPPPGLGGHAPDQLARAVPAEPLIIGEEEHLVLHDGPAEGGAENVLREIGLPGRGHHAVVLPRVRGQAVVAPVFEQVPVELVGARLDRAADQGTRHVSELSGVVVRVDPHFRERIRAGLVEQPVVDRVVHVDAVEHVVVRLLALAVHEGPARPEVLWLGEAVRLGGHGPWQQKGKLGEVTPIQGHVLDSGP